MARVSGPGRGRLDAREHRRGGRTCRRLRQRPARAGDPQGRHRRDPGPDDARVDAVRPRALVGRRDRRADLRQQLPRRRRVHPRAFGVGRGAVRGRRPTREGQRAPRSAPEARARAHLRRPRRARGPRPGLCEPPPRRAPGGDRRGRRGRPVHADLHLRDDRAAEGLHDHAPQPVRDGARLRRPRGLHRAGRHDAAVPAARAQLRPPDVADRRLPGRHAGAPARPAPGRGRARRGPGRRSSRASRASSRKCTRPCSASSPRRRA